MSRHCQIFSDYLRTIIPDAICLTLAYTFNDECNEILECVGHSPRTSQFEETNPLPYFVKSKVIQSFVENRIAWTFFQMIEIFIFKQDVSFLRMSTLYESFRVTDL